MGIFRYRIEIAASPAGPFETLEAIVDSGAAYTQAPRSLLQRLGVRPIDRATFVLANGQPTECDIGEAAIRIDGCVRTNVVVFGEEGTPSLLGAFTLESFLLAPDPVNKRLIPVPGYLLAATAMAIRQAIEAIANQNALTSRYSDITIGTP